MRLFEIEQSEFSNAKESKITLYRGARNQGDSFIGTIRTDRNTLHSSWIDVKIFDGIMERLGVPHRKSNTLSVTRIRSHTDGYGDEYFGDGSGVTYCIYPSNNSQYMYSNIFYDYYDMTQGFINTHAAAFFKQYYSNFMAAGVYWDKVSDNHWNLFIDALVKKYGSEFQTTHDINALDNVKSEILVYGDKYLAEKYQ